MGAKQSPKSLFPSKKNLSKVPKRIHKAEREKMKREHLNDLFLQLADALEMREQNSGKASILGETTRAVKVMLDQIKRLKTENAALLSESRYVTVEKNELEEETATLHTQISELKNVIKERTVQTKLDLNLNVPPVESLDSQSTHYFEHKGPVLNPVFVIRDMSNVRKPHPRYPTPSDSWPFQLLEKP